MHDIIAKTLIHNSLFPSIPLQNLPTEALSHWYKTFAFQFDSLSLIRLGRVHVVLCMSQGII